MTTLQLWNRSKWPLSLIYVSWRKRYYILGLTLLGAIAAGSFVMLSPKSYRASALVLVEPQKVPDKYVSSAVSTDVQDRLASISQQILSNTRLQKIIDDFKLYRKERNNLYPEEILELMRKKINIKLEKGWAHDRPGAFHVEFEGSEPAIVAEVTNRLVSLFLEENLRERELSAEGTSDFLEAQLQDARRKLEVLEKDVAQYKLKHVGALPGQEGFLIATITRLQQELQFTEDAITRDNLSKTTIDSAMQASKSSALLAAQLSAKSQPAEERPAAKPSERIATELGKARLRFTPKHPTVIDLEQELENARAIEKKEELAVVKRTAPESPQYLQWQMQSKDREESFKTQLLVLDQDLAHRTKQRTEILAKMAKFEGQLALLPVSEMQMGTITRDYELSLANYKGLLEKRQNAHMAGEMERRQKGESFKIIDPARIPQKALGLPIELVIALGAVGGLALSVTLFVVICLRKNQLLGEWELPDNVPMLVRIPVIALPISKASQGSNGSRRMRIAAAVGVPLIAVACTALFVAYRLKG